MFAWEAARKGLDVHMLAEPTKLEALKSEFETKKGEFKSQMDKSILEKYGGQEHLEAPPRYSTALLFSTVTRTNIRDDGPGD
jgi:pre-mRNA-processing factor SLU7